MRIRKIIKSILRTGKIFNRDKDSVDAVIIVIMTNSSLLLNQFTKKLRTYYKKCNIY